MNAHNGNRKPTKKIQPRWYQTNASLSQPPSTAADRPVREYVTNINLSGGRGQPSSLHGIADLVPGP
ncbi:MAG: hypothetical protein JOZ23_11605 [Mycobacterium sp.]|nr:hypothetical protein [Mycobacterium sp.]